MASFIRIGQIINTHGYQGELKVFPLTDDIERYKELEHVYLNIKEEYRKYTVKNVRFHKQMVLLTLTEVSDMAEAEKLKAIYLELPEAELKKLPAGHYYIYQLIGLNVYEGERFLGKITDIIKTGSNDVYIVEDTLRRKPLLIPALKDVVKEIDLRDGLMRVELLPGLED